MPDFSTPFDGPRLPVVLLLDTSAVMGARGDGTLAPITQLNEAFAALCDYIQSDELLCMRLDLLVITSGGCAQVAIPFTGGRDLVPRRFEPEGSSCTGAALRLAVRQIEEREREYTATDLRRYRPLLLIWMLGTCHDDDLLDGAKLVRAAERDGQLHAVCFGLGSDAEVQSLGMIFEPNRVLPLRGADWQELLGFRTHGVVDLTVPDAASGLKDVVV